MIPVLPTNPAGLTAEEMRNIGIGVGVGVGGLLLILVLVLLIALCCAKYRKGQRHSKYVLNYNTVYGKSPRKSNLHEG